MSPPPDTSEFFAELEETGEEEVRSRFVSGAIYGHDKRPFVELWLKEKDQARQDAFKREEIDIARDAASSTRDAAVAAREAAKAAKSAANTAKIAVLIAAIAIIISGITLFS